MVCMRSLWATWKGQLLLSQWPQPMQSPAVFSSVR